MKKSLMIAGMFCACSAFADPVVINGNYTLNVGDAIHARDLKLPEGVELVIDPDEIVVVIAASRGVEAASPEEEAETSAADVEVVAKGKAAKEEEGAE